MFLNDKDIRKFERAALQRLASAELLLEHGHHLDAVYLAGYVVELALKALILRRTSRGELQATWERLTESGTKGHDFEFLKHMLGETGCRLSRSIVDDLRTVRQWSTDLRYEVGFLEFEEANTFVASARTIREWAERS